VTHSIPNPELAQYFDRIAEEAGVPPFHHHFTPQRIQSGDYELHLDVFEYDKSAPTVIYIPGTSVYSLCYAELLFKLGCTGYNIVGLDPRGHGQSSGTRGDYTISEIMEDALAVKDFVTEHFNEKVSFMGSSQGGIVSLYLAASRDDIDCVICQNFADLTHEETRRIANVKGGFSYLRPLVKQFGSSFENVQVPISTYLDLHKVKLRHFGNVKRFIDQDPLALKSISLRALRSLMTTQLAVPLDKITTPVMVFQGTNDSIFPMRYTQRIYDQLNCKKRMKLFPGLNHALMIDDTDEILPHLSAWLHEIYGKS
jgi:pimeloyl-ACP methyl ester carboxylesterase